MLILLHTEPSDRFVLLSAVGFSVIIVIFQKETYVYVTCGRTYFSMSIVPLFLKALISS